MCLGVVDLSCHTVLRNGILPTAIISISIQNYIIYIVIYISERSVINVFAFFFKVQI